MENKPDRELLKLEVFPKSGEKNYSFQPLFSLSLSPFDPTKPFRLHSYDTTLSACRVLVTHPFPYIAAADR